MDDAELIALGYKVERAGKMVPDGNGGLIEQVILTPPGYSGPVNVPRPQPASGTIYFVGPKGGPIKIGFASRLEMRLKDLRTMNAYELIIHATVEGPPKMERDYHKQFSEYRLHGEWFEPASPILAEITRLKGE